MIDLPVRGPQAPQGNIPPLQMALPYFAADAPLGTVWLVGAHGGAGVSTLAQLSPFFADARRAWPQGQSPSCLLVARTSALGLMAARSAVTQWAGGYAGTSHLIGLVLVDDAPGRLPKPLAELAALVASGAPRAWRIAWNHAWRCGEPVDLDARSTPPAVRRFVGEVQNLTTDQSPTTH